jgi:hypothetical protein
VRRAALLALVALCAAPGCGDSVDTAPAPWTLTREAGRTLELDVDLRGGSCRTVHRTDVVEDEDSVRITALVREATGDRCREGREHEPAEVILLAERDGRTLTGCDPDDRDAVCEAPTP